MTQTQTMVELLSQVQDAATVLQRQQRLRRGTNCRGGAVPQPHAAAEAERGQVDVADDDLGGARQWWRG